MDAPKCRLCGERHYGRCQKFAEPVEKPRKAVPIVEITARSEGNGAAKFDRNAYQRELMRKRRAKAKT